MRDLLINANITLTENIILFIKLIKNNFNHEVIHFYRILFIFLYVLLIKFISSTNSSIAVAIKLN